jgi:3-deoxy-D-manno-octulosonic-acid transferase
VYLLYDFILLLSVVVLIPLGIIKGLSYGHILRGLGERLAIYRAERLEALKGRKVIWVHAVSVGETRASIPLLKGLRKKFPDAAIVLSSLTFTGRATADEIDEPDLCLFLPYDHSWIVKRALKKIQPDIVLLVETELWPNFLRMLASGNTPILLVNGRISDRSFPRYWLVRSLIAPMLQAITRFCMQSRQDELRIIRLGADSANVCVTGNLKFDLPPPGFNDEDISDFKSTLKIPTGLPVWVAGSTRQGEEELILDAFRQLLEKGVKLILVLVPRYPDRAKSICELVEKSDFAYELRSNVVSRTRKLSNSEVLIGDTLGEMLRFYACADVVFVGGSLVPIGGHNILEASLLNKPVVFGPHMQNFKSISQLLLAAGGGFQVGTGELADKVEALLEDPAKAKEIGRKGGELFAEHSGATDRTIEEVALLLDTD